MEPILDEEFNQIDNDSSVLTANIPLRTTLYIAVMLLGGFIFFHAFAFENATPKRIILEVINSIIVCTFISVVLETIRFIIRKMKDRSSGKANPQDPFWFKVHEGGFAIWILFFGLSTLYLLIWG